MKKAVVIVEAISTGVFYEQDILDRGYQPLVIYPYIESSQEDKAVYEGIREASRKQLSDRTVEIPDDGDFDHLLTALAPYDIACVVAGSEMGSVLADRLAEALGLPGNPSASSILHRNKDLMQEALRKHGLRSIRGKVVHTLEEVRSFWQELSVSHVVIKPVSGAGTGGAPFLQFPGGGPAGRRGGIFQYGLFRPAGRGPDHAGADRGNGVYRQHC